VKDLLVKHLADDEVVSRSVSVTISLTAELMCCVDSGVGAGIDSYYEYLLKAYIMLGDETYLNRFNKVLHCIISCFFILFLFLD